MAGDSSPDLSLKLRRGSSDSRDSFYMDFARGIDSDIEDVPSTSALHGEDDSLPADEDTGSWPGLNAAAQQPPGDPPLLPSPASPCPVIVSPETLSHSSPKKALSGRSGSPSCKNEALSERSGAETPTLSLPKKTVTGLCASPTFRQDALSMRSGLTPAPLSGLSPYLYHGHPHLYQNNLLKPRPSRLEQLQTDWKRMGSDALAATLSALYGKLLVVMGIAFPMAEVISTYIPPTFYEGFYLYLYCGSMLFLLYMYAMLLRHGSRGSQSFSGSQNSVTDDNVESAGNTDTDISSSTRSYKEKNKEDALDPQYHYGSFYLRMGAVAFGIGSMIYSGLEFGQYFELEPDTKCHNVLLALTPATRMVFIFAQMYFIFLNDEQVRVHRHKLLARFGLMHMIGTNLSLWLNVLIQETKHEILTFYDPENGTLMLQHRINYPGVMNRSARVPRGLKGPHHIYECRRTNIMGSLVQDASGFLFPCTIEYSLICAAILYVMWKNISRVEPAVPPTRQKLGLPETQYRRSPHHYSVDCAGAHKGLFVGILILVLTIISLILFFVLISKPEFVSLAVMEVNICELALYGLSLLATLIGMIQVRQLKFEQSRNLELDNILLIGAQTGMFIYSTFTIIGGQFTIERNTALVLMTALASLLQTTAQTVFVLDASRRSCITLDHVRRKPGRQIVTFLLVTNLAMWAVSTLEKSRAESHPIQLHFYGLWAWTIITHVSMPLAIFYRFHSTVCLCEIWKKAYKIKPTYM